MIESRHEEEDGGEKQGDQEVQIKGNEGNEGNIVDHEEKNQKDDTNDKEKIILSNIPRYQDIMCKCENKAREILVSSQKKMIDAIESVHNKENEHKNHIRLHYDDKLNTCRVSYLLQNRHASKMLHLKKMEAQTEIQEHYSSKLKVMSSLLQQSQDVVRVQEKTVVECQERTRSMEKELDVTRNEFETFKVTMTTKCNKLEEDLNRKTKQEVWAHFKIMHLKKKLKKVGRLLQVKKHQCKGLVKDVKELEDKLRVSLDIREGMEKSFERRARIRGRFDILNDQDSHNLGATKFTRRVHSSSTCRTCSRQSSDYEKCEKQCQTDCTQAEFKDQAVDSPPFFDDEINTLKHELAELHIKLKNYQVALRQNEAYKRLLSGKNIAMILASEHRKLAKPKSLDAELLYDLTSPQGVLLDQKPCCQGVGEEVLVNKSKVTNTNDRQSANSIPLSTMIGFEGIQGKVFETSQGNTMEC